MAGTIPPKTVQASLVGAELAKACALRMNFAGLAPDPELNQEQTLQCATEVVRIWQAIMASMIGHGFESVDGDKLRSIVPDVDGLNVADIIKAIASKVGPS